MPVEVEAGGATLPGLELVNGHIESDPADPSNASRSGSEATALAGSLHADSSR